MTGRGLLDSAVVHLHPTLKCNLSCAHCYSSSSPTARGELPVETATAILRKLRSERYSVLSISGGEPLLYRELETLVIAASDMGFVVNIVTNGSPAHVNRLSSIAERVNLVAVSVEGTPEHHNRMRRSTRAFAGAERGLDAISRFGIRVAVSSCVTRSTLVDVPWLYEFSVEHGAQQLQLRALGDIGRGRELSPLQGLTDADCTRLMVVASVLDTDKSCTTRVRVDLAPTSSIVPRVAAMARALRAAHPTTPLAHLVNPIIVDESGVVLPWAYGVSAKLAIASGPDGLSLGMAQLRTMSHRTYADVLTGAADRAVEDGRTYLDWYAHLTRFTHRLSQRQVLIGGGT
jgi:Fe-coproporphyrin III synthase